MLMWTWFSDFALIFVLLTPPQDSVDFLLPRCSWSSKSSWLTGAMWTFLCGSNLWCEWIMKVQKLKARSPWNSIKLNMNVIPGSTSPHLFQLVPTRKFFQKQLLLTLKLNAFILFNAFLSTLHSLWLASFIVLTIFISLSHWKPFSLSIFKQLSPDVTSLCLMFHLSILRLTGPGLLTATACLESTRYYKLCSVYGCFVSLCLVSQDPRFMAKTPKPPKPVF